MKTTRTAQYLQRFLKSEGFVLYHEIINKRTHAAHAPKISCRFALVNKKSTTENKREATSKTPMLVALDLLG